jgi:hypothetical protein
MRLAIRGCAVLRGAFTVALLVWTAPQADAQTSGPTAPMPLGIFVGSERERYLRVLQTLRLVPLYPWSIRGFSPAEVDRLRPSSDGHPWAEYAGFSSVRRSRGTQQEILPAGFTARYNTGFPSAGCRALIRT